MRRRAEFLYSCEGRPAKPKHFSQVLTIFPSGKGSWRKKAAAAAAAAAAVAGGNGTGRMEALRRLWKLVRPDAADVINVGGVLVERSKPLKNEGSNTVISDFGLELQALGTSERRS